MEALARSPSSLISPELRLPSVSVFVEDSRRCTALRRSFSTFLNRSRDCLSIGFPFSQIQWPRVWVYGRGELKIESPSRSCFSTSNTDVNTTPRQKQFELSFFPTFPGWLAQQHL